MVQLLPLVYGASTREDTKLRIGHTIVVHKLFDNPAKEVVSLYDTNVAPVLDAFTKHIYGFRVKSLHKTK